MSDTAILPETQTAEAPPEPPPPPPPQPHILVERLERLDRDYSGEIKFSTLALSSLRSFLARHENDHAVADTYTQAIRALEALPAVLAGAQARVADEVTRKVTERLAAVQDAHRTQQTREYADQWAASAPPPPALDDAVEVPEPLPDVLRTQYDPDIVEPLPAGLTDAPPTPTDAAATPPPPPPSPPTSPEEGI